MLWRQFAWASGYRQYSLEALHNDGQAPAIASDGMRRALGLYLDPLRLEVLAALLCLTAIARAALSSGDVALACWIAAASVMPNMVAYPNISAIGVALVTVMFAAYTLAAWLFTTAAVAARGRVMALRPRMTGDGRPLRVATPAGRACAQRGMKGLR